MTPCPKRALYTSQTVDGRCEQPGSMCDKCIELTAMSKIDKIESHNVMTFEQFLEDGFINSKFVGYDDQIPDAVDAYMENLEPVELLRLGQEYGNYRARGRK